MDSQVDGIELGYADEEIQQDGIDFDYQPPIVDTGIALARAEKWDFGLGEDSPGVDKLYTGIMSGEETNDQMLAAARENSRLADIKRNLILEIAKDPNSYGPNAAQMVDNLTMENIQNPETIMEKMYARRMATTAGSMVTDDEGKTPYEAAVEENPDAAFQHVNVFEDVITKKESFQKIFEGVAKEFQDQNVISKGIQFGFQMVPFYSSVTQMSRLPASSWLLGDNIEEQKQYLWSLPNDQAIEAYKNTIEQMRKTDPMNAMLWGSYMLEFSGNDQFLNNLVAVADPLLVGSSIATKVPRLANALKTTAKALSGPTMDANRVLEAGGDVLKAAINREISKIDTAAGKVGANFQPIKDAAIGIFDVAKVQTGATAAVGVDAAAKLELTLAKRAEQLLQTITGGNLVSRLTEGTKAMEIAFQEAAKAIPREYPKTADRIMDIDLVPADDVLNVPMARARIGTAPEKTAPELKVKRSKKKKDEEIVRVVKMGKQGVGAFADIDSAVFDAEKMIGLKPGSYQVVPHGPGYMIQLTRPLDEITDAVRDGLIFETTNVTPRGFRNIFSDFLRVTDEIMPENIVKEMKTVYGQSALVGVMKEALAPVGKLHGQSWRDWDQFTRMQAEWTNPLTGRRGQFSDTVGQMAADWQQEIGRPPTLKEIDAYFAYRQANDTIYAAYNMSTWAAKSRIGMRQLTLDFMTELGNMTAKIEGRVVQSLPWDVKDWDAGIMVWDVDPAKRVYKRLQLNASKKELEKQVSSGKYSIIQLSRFSNQSLREAMQNKGLPKGDIDFLLVKNPKLQNLPLQQIPFRPGGHSENVVQWYLRQPEVAMDSLGYHNFYGDKNILAFATKEKGAHFETAFNKAMEILGAANDLRKGNRGKGVAKNPGQAALKEKELRDFLPKNLPWNYKEFKSLFKEFDESAQLSLGEKVHLTYDHDSTYKAGKLQHYKNLRDAKDSPFNLYNQNIDLRFGMERNAVLNTVETTGTPGNPIYKFQPSKLVDAASTIERSGSYMMRSRYLNDLKTKMAEQFVQEFGHLLDDTMENLRNNPVAALIDPKWKGALSGKEYQAAKTFSAKAKEHFHLKDDVGRQVDSWRSRMLEGLLNKNESWGRWAEPYLMHRIKDPVTYMKAFAFNMKMLAPHQLFLQANSVVNIAAIEGVQEATKGTFLGNGFYRAGINAPASHVDHLATQAAQWGIKPEHFKESLQALKESGYWRVGKEFATLDMDPSVAFSLPGKGIEAGRWFFKEGEKVARLSAWATSYNKWRAKNPTAVFDRQARKIVLDRADLYTGNMSSASNASWQHNKFTALPTQFWSYPVRLAEQFYGKRLTGAEKRRMFMTYGMMYGWPSSIGLAMPFLPAHEFVRKEQVTNPNGFVANMFGNADSNLISQIMYQGIGGYIQEQIVGTPQNFGERFGLGMTFVNDIIEGDKTVIQTLLGASGTVWGDMIQAADPFVYYFAGIFNGEPYPLAKEDWIEMGNSNAMFNSARKVWQGITAGKHYTKSGKEVMDIEGAEVLSGLLTNTIPQRISDLYKFIENDRDRKAMQRDLKKDAEENFKRGLENPADRKMYWKKASRAIQAGEFTPSQQADMMRDLLRGANKGLLEDTINSMRNQPEEVQQQFKDKVLRSNDGNP